MIAPDGVAGRRRRVAGPAFVPGVVGRRARCAVVVDGGARGLGSDPARSGRRRCSPRGSAMTWPSRRSRSNATNSPGPGIVTGPTCTCPADAGRDELDP